MLKAFGVMLACLSVGSSIVWPGAWASPPASPLSSLKVGLVLDKGGKDDQSFNAAAHRGVKQAQAELGYAVKVVEATDDNAFEPLLRSLASRDYDLIVGVGVAQAEVLGKVARQFPQRKFAIVDAEVKEPNVRSLVFAEHEGSYLVGAIAALFSQSGKIGFIGGMEIPLIRRFQMGYVAGAKKVRPSIEVVTNYVGVTPEAWANPARGKELALSQYSRGVDVIFSAAGASGRGVFDAAEQKKLYAIGVDSNQNGLRPGRILTSMLKRVDVAVFKACEDLAHGKWTSNRVRYGLSTDGVGYAMDSYNDALVTPAIRATVELKADLIAGRIKAPDFYLARDHGN